MSFRPLIVTRVACSPLCRVVRLMRVLFKTPVGTMVLLVLALLFVWKSELATLAAAIALFMLGMFTWKTVSAPSPAARSSAGWPEAPTALWKSLLFGITSTALVQSSSLVTLLSIAFLSAGMISLVAGIGIVFGANLGHHHRRLADCPGRS